MDLKTRGILLSVCIFSLGYIQAQNLIMNASFESINLFKGNVDFISNLKDNEAFVEDTAVAWHFINKEFARVSCSYWNGAGADNYTPNSLTYYSDSGYAYRGKCFGVIKMFQESYTPNTYNIYNIVAEFAAPLVEGATYKLSFYVSHFSGTNSVRELNIKFIDSISESSHHDIPLNARIDMDTTIISVPITFSTLYNKIQIAYKAKGGERFMLMGNLKYSFPKKSAKTILYGYKRYSNHGKYCLLAVDNFTLERDYEHNDSMKHYNTSTDAIQIWDTVLVKTFEYDNDSYQLLNISKDTIKTLCRTLDYAEKVIIIGHTDSTGAELYNQTLSYRRASDFSIELSKYCKYNITIAGYGYSQPLQRTNGLTSNRRIEILAVIKKKP